MRMTAAILSALLVLPSIATASDLTDALCIPIAVEVQTGRPAPHDFAGYVGTLRLQPDFTDLYIVETEGVMLHTRHLQLGNVKPFQRGIQFDGMDADGYEYTGRIWLENKPEKVAVVMVEIVRVDSPRRIVNLSQHGRRFIKENRLTQFEFGRNR